MLLAALPALRVETSGELPCELDTRLKAAALEQKLTLDDVAAHRLIVTSSGDALVVRLVDSAAQELGQRTLRPTQKDCAVLPRTVILLARTWLSARLPAAAAVEPVDAGPPAVEVPRRVTPPPPRRPVEPVADAGSAPETVDAGILIIDAGTPQPPPRAEPPDAGPARPIVTPTTDAGTPTPRTVSLAVAGGISLDVERPVGQFSLFVDWAFFKALGATVELGLDTPRSVAVSPGAVTLQSYWGSLALRVAFFSRLHASLGARLFVMPAASVNVTTPSSLVLITGGFFASADWRQPLTEWLFVMARVGGLVLIRPEVLVVPGTNGALILPAWSFFAHAGVGLKL